MYCAGFAIHVCIVGLSFVVRTVSYCIVSYSAGFAVCIVLYHSWFVSCWIVLYRTVLPEKIHYEPRIVCTVWGFVSCRIVLYGVCHICRPIVLYRPRFVSCCIVLYGVCHICRPIVLYRPQFVSCCIVLCIESYRTDTILGSCCTFSDRIKIPFSRFVFGSYHDFSRAVLHETYGTMCGRHDTILGA
jgi:hypothetical protein